MRKKLTSTILIPAYNEEKSIIKCISSCLHQSEKPEEIIVVNDGSTDRTLEFLRLFGNDITIVNLKKNTGNKSKAQEIGLKSIRTEIFITTDADTELDFNFVKEIKRTFKRNPRISAVCGFVESKKNNWVTGVREINYLIGQTIYKKAQKTMGALFVLAGCSSAFKTEDFRETIKFEHDNVTEDLDFTYKFKLADKKIYYNEDAIVYTQDPNNLKSYFKQLYRWYSGGWTCLRKNINILKKPNNALILSLIYFEGLFMGGVMFLTPLLIFLNLNLFLYILVLQLMVVALSMSYGVFKFKRYGLYFYIPYHYVLSWFDEGIFVYTFVKEFIFHKKNMTWQRADRY